MIETPKEAQKRYCRECLGGRLEDECQGNTIQCPFYPYRKKEGHVPVKTHRRICLHCMNGSSELVAGCQAEDCACHPYRFGQNPSLIGKRKAPKAGIEALMRFNQNRRDDVKERLESTFTDRHDTFPV